MEDVFKEESASGEWFCACVSVCVHGCVYTRMSTFSHAALWLNWQAGLYASRDLLRVQTLYEIDVSEKFHFWVFAQIDFRRETQLFVPGGQVQALLSPISLAEETET